MPSFGGMFGRVGADRRGRVAERRSQVVVFVLRLATGQQVVFLVQPLVERGLALRVVGDLPEVDVPAADFLAPVAGTLVVEQREVVRTSPASERRRRRRGFRGLAV